VVRLLRGERYGGHDERKPHAEHQAVTTAGQTVQTQHQCSHATPPFPLCGNEARRAALRVGSRFVWRDTICGDSRAVGPVGEIRAS
jgi:hypothetical protein